MAIERMTVDARTGRAARLRAGDRVAVVNTHGTQVVDFWALGLPDASECLSMAHTRSSLRRLRPRAGDTLVTNRREPILRLLEDTSSGVHDTVIAACDLMRYHQLGVKGYHANCCDNFRAAVAAAGVERTEVPDPLNLFMNFPWDAEGRLEALPTVGAPGDRVIFAAERDLLVVVSACPMDLVPINGAAGPVDIDLEVTRGQDAVPYTQWEREVMT